MRRYRAGVIGCGVAGSLVDSEGPSPLPQSHAGLYASDPRFELTAACDPNPERLSRFEATWKPRYVYQSAGDMLRQLGPQGVDVVSIASPTDTHIEILSAMVSSTIPVVVVEKPIAASVRDAEPLRRLLSVQHTKVVVNYQRRFTNGFLRLAQHLRDGRFGKIVRVQINYPIGIVHSGSHGIDLLCWFFGPPGWVQALYGLEGDVSDGLVDCVLGWDGGLRASLNGFARQPWNIFEIDVLGTAGRVRCTNGGRTMDFYGVDIDRDYPHLHALVPVKEPFANDWESTYLNLADHVVELLENPGIRPRCGFEDGYEALRVAEAAVLSAREGGRSIRL